MAKGIPSHRSGILAKSIHEAIHPDQMLPTADSLRIERVLVDVDQDAPNTVKDAASKIVSKLANGVLVPVSTGSSIEKMIREFV